MAAKKINQAQNWILADELSDSSRPPGLANNQAVKFVVKRWIPRAQEFGEGWLIIRWICLLQPFLMDLLLD